MKNKTNIFHKTALLLLSLIMTSFVVSCVGDELFRDDLPNSNSMIDNQLPEANFSYSADENDFTIIHFQDLSSESNVFSWNFGNGATSDEQDPTYTFPGEGTYPVTLTTSDSNGASDSITIDVEVVEPEEPEVPDPVLVNADFDKLPRLSGSDCSCSAWDNDDIGEQGESSTVGGVESFLKWDNNEPDHIYQEFEVVPNADYLIEIVVSFKPLENNTPPAPSMLELRVLAGSGYIGGYSPTYYATAEEFPSSGYGYTTVAQVEDSANNLLTETIANPSTEDYITYTYIFNSGANDSVALFVRGIGGAATGDYGYNSGDEEIRADSVTITAYN